MKYSVLCLVALSVLLISCNTPTEPDKENSNLTLLKSSQNAVDSAVMLVFSDASLAGKNMLDSNFKEVSVRAELKSILTKHPTIMEALYVNAEGIMTYVEPTAYSGSEGVDISDQEHQIQMKATNKNAMSGIFKIVENYDAIVLAAPILKNGIMVGSVNIVIKPHDFIAFYTDAYIKDKADDFVVMEANGNMIYDLDPTQTGLNMFTDLLYKAFPSLLEVGHKVANEESGQSYYTFLDKTKQTTIYKDVWWRTSSYYGRIWKFAIIKERS